MGYFFASQLYWPFWFLLWAATGSEGAGIGLASVLTASILTVMWRRDCGA